MNAPWRIELLGTLQARQGDHCIARFRTHKNGVLLAYLAFYLRRVHARETLIDLLWPQVGLDQGRPSLSVALSSLRHQLEPPGVPSGAVIVANHVTVQLNTAACTTDVSEFEAGLERARSQSGRDQLQTLGEAIEIYHGELLPGYYEDWILMERERLAESYLQALRQLVKGLAQAHEPRRALDYAQRAVQAAPLREELHRDLMVLYTAIGQPSSALRQYQELENLLRTELNAPPSETTRKLARAIETRHASPREAASSESKPQTSLPQTFAPTAPSTIQARDPVGAASRPAVSLSPGMLTLLLAARVDSAGDRLREGALSEVFRQQCARYGGYLLPDSDGEYLSLFERMSDALACAVALRRESIAGSSAEDVSSPPVSPVTIALHLGEVGANTMPFQPAKEDMGPLLSYGRKLLQAAHPGQTLCSGEAAMLLRRNQEPGLRVRELGMFRLHGEPAPEALFQILFPDAPALDFPPPKAESSQAGSLPLQFTRFFGRDEEIARLEAMLRPAAAHERGEETSEGGTSRQAPTRLVTLTGPGGTGKTRLAMEVASRLIAAFQGAVWFVPLADLSEARYLIDAVREALRLPAFAGREPLDQVAEALSRQPSLLVLDNFEQLVEEGAAEVLRLLERLPTVTCLVTSRQHLNVSGEQEVVLSPLPTPHEKDSPERLLHCESVQLFVDRAQAVKPDFQVTSQNAAAVATLCVGLEGMPLAIELAAARAMVLTPAQMLDQMEHRLDFLVSRKRDIVARQRTLRAAIDWSFRLLSPELQRFFAQLSVFRGGWSLDAAETVCQEPLALDYLAQLRECSLVVTEDDSDRASEIRFGMLESLRAYAAEQLSAEEGASIAQRHAGYYRALVETVTSESSQDELVARFATEHENLRAALDWLHLQGEPDACARLCVQLAAFWERRGWLHEGRQYLLRCLERQDLLEPGNRIRLLGRLGWFADLQGDYAEAIAYQEQSLALARQTGDEDGELLALNNLALATQAHGRLSEARGLFEQSLEIARRRGDTPRQAARLSNLGLLATQERSYEEARRHLMEAYTLYRRLGNTWGTIACLCNLGDLALQSRSWEEAERFLQEGLTLSRQEEDRPGIAYILANLADVAVHRADFPVAGQLLQEALSICAELGMRALVPTLLETQAQIQAAQRREEEALFLLAVATDLREALHAPRTTEEATRKDTLEADLLPHLRQEEVQAIRRRAIGLAPEEILAHVVKLHGIDSE